MFGFGRGKVELKLEKMSFAPGEKIKGQLVMELKKPLKAEKAYVKLYAEAKTTNLSAGKHSTNTRKVYDFTLPLDGAKEYSGQLTYDFEVVVPSGTLNTASQFEGAVGTAVRAISLLSGRMMNINWFLQGGLDISLGLDFSKTVKLNVS